MVPVTHGYPTWCACGWNLAPTRDRPLGRLERFYAWLGRRHRERLFHEVATQGATKPSPGSASVIALALSVLIVSSPLFLVALGLAVFAIWGIGIVTVVLGSILALLVWLTWPRDRTDESVVLTTATSHPRLHALVKSVADELDAPVPDEVGIYPRVNAYVSQSLLRRRRTLVLGAPLFTCLDEQEIVALIGHELGHFVNGDTARGAIVGSAFSTLAGWYRLFTGDGDEPVNLTAAGEVLAAVFTKTAALIPLGGLIVMLHLTWAQSQRAEYYADKVGAGLAGTDGFVGMLGWLVDPQIVWHAVQRVHVGSAELPLYEEMSAQVKALPARERERRLQLAARAPKRLGDTHPPTTLRVRMLQEAERELPRLRLSSTEHAAIVREVATESRKTEQAWLSRYEHWMRTGV